MNIEKNIPIPGLNRATGITVNLKKMAVGDSVVIERTKQNSWRTSAYHLNMKLVVHKLNATECRVWRVS